MQSKDWLVVRYPTTKVRFACKAVNTNLDALEIGDALSSFEIAKPIPSEDFPCRHALVRCEVHTVEQQVKNQRSWARRAFTRSQACVQSVIWLAFCLQSVIL